MTRINVQNLDKVNALLAEVQRGCRSRTTTAENIEVQSWAAELKLQDAGIPEKMRQGARAYMLPEQVANSYKGIAMGTMVTLERGSKSWFVTGAHRGHAGNCAYGGNERLRVEVAFRADLVDAMARKQGITISRTEEQRQWDSLCPKEATS